MSYTRISDNLFDSSLWSDGSYEGVCALKLFLACLGEARQQRGRVRRLTAAKAARVGAVPLELALVAIERLTNPDANDSSGVAEGRRLLPDPDGGPNDFIVTNWGRYGELFAKANAAARQQTKRERDKARDEGVTESRSRHANHGKRDGGRDTEKKEKKNQTHIGSRGLPAEEAKAFEEDLSKLRGVAKTARRGRVEKLWRQHVQAEGLDQVRALIARGVGNYGAALAADRGRGFDRQPKEDATLLGEILAGDWQESGQSRQPSAPPAPLSPAVLELAELRRQGATR